MAGERAASGGKTGATGRRPSAAETRRRRTHDLAILNAIAEALNREVDLGRALGAALSQVAARLGLRTGWVWLLDEATGAPCPAAKALPTALADAPGRMAGAGSCLDPFRDGDPRGAANVNVVTCSRLGGTVPLAGSA